MTQKIFKRKLRKNRPFSEKPEKDGLTKQSFKSECDLNKIVSSAVAGNPLPAHLNRQKSYGIQKSDFMENQFLVAEAKTEFANLSPEHLERFSDINDFISAYTDPTRTNDVNDIPIESETLAQVFIDAQNGLQSNPPDDQAENETTSESESQQDSSSDDVVIQDE